MSVILHAFLIPGPLLAPWMKNGLHPTPRVDVALLIAPPGRHMVKRSRVILDALLNRLLPALLAVVTALLAVAWSAPIIALVVLWHKMLRALLAVALLLGTLGMNMASVILHVF